MAVSPVHDSRGTITCKKLKRKSATRKESKTKQRSAIWQMKRRLVKQRLMDLSRADENEESVPMETPILLHTPKESPANDVNTSVGVSNSTMERTKEIQANLSESLVSFKYVKGFKDFSIKVDGLMIDAEIPLHLRTKYYELCRSQNVFLHENLMKGLNTKLAAGMISETVNIADAIRAATGAAADHLHDWDVTLKAFEGLGMVVGFLRARIDKLLSLSLSREAQAAIELKRRERTEAKEETQRLNMKLLDVKMRIHNLDAEIEGLVAKNVEQSYVFREVAAAPW